MMGMCGGMAVLWLLGGVLLLGLGVGAVALVVWAVRRSQPSTSSVESALEILKRRYARGEISAEQFEKMKRQLSES